MITYISFADMKGRIIISG